MRTKKIVLLQRVITNYRLPTFTRISQIEGYDLTVFHGPNFHGTKIENTKNMSNLKTRKLWSVPIRFNTKNGLVAMPFSPLLFYYLIRHNPDILICEGASNLVNTSIAFTYKVLFKKKLLWWSLGQVPNRTKSLVRKIVDKWVFTMERKADAIIAYNTHAKEYFISEARVDPNKIYIALNVIDTDKRLLEASQFDKIKVYQQAHKDKDFIILYVGAIIKGKNLDVLLEAFSYLEKSVEGKYNVALTIVGKGDEKTEIEQLSQKLGIKNIVFVGEVNEGVSRYFLESDIFVLPGLGGLAIPDAMLHGLPVIASSADGSESDFIDGQNGMIIPKIDSENLYTTLKDLCENGDRLKDMKQHAFDTIKNRHNIHSFIHQIEKALYSVSE